MNKNIFLLIFILIFYSCSGPLEYTLKPEGDQAIFLTKSGLEFSGEFLFAKDSILFFLCPDSNYKIYSTTFFNIKSLKFEGYTSPKWKKGIFYTQIVPAIIIGIVGASFVDDGVYAGLLISVAFSIPALISYSIFNSSIPDPPGIENPNNINELKGLLKYSRFPYGLNQLQFEKLMQKYKQTKIIKLN